jgi:hypothetical protein
VLKNTDLSFQTETSKSNTAFTYFYFKSNRTKIHLKTKIIMKKSLFLLSSMVVNALAGCSTLEKPNQSLTAEVETRQAVDSNHKGLLPDSRPIAEETSINTTLLTPLFVVLAIDRTGSKADNKLPDMTLAQVNLLVEGIRRRRGELRMTTISDNSDKAMPHIKFIPSGKPPQAPIQKKTSESNLLAKVDIQEQQDLEMATYRKQKADFDKSQQAQEVADKAEIVNFTKIVQPLIERPANFPASDMRGIVLRGNLALQELQPVGKQSPRRVLFLITDGEHNATKDTKVPALDAQTELVIVSGGKGAGIFEPLNPKKYDSIDSAIDYILSR